MINDNSAIAHATYDAYVRKDRAAIEALIADDFRFTSPLDNGLNRASYFAICWPNSTNIEAFEFVHMLENGERFSSPMKARASRRAFATRKSSRSGTDRSRRSKSISAGTYPTMCQSASIAIRNSVIAGEQTNRLGTLINSAEGCNQ